MAVAGRLNGEADESTDLTMATVRSRPHASRLWPERCVAFQGDIKRGPFDIPGDLAESGCGCRLTRTAGPNADVLKPWVNGMDLTRRPAGKWIVDFRRQMSKS